MTDYKASFASLKNRIDRYEENTSNHNLQQLQLQSFNHIDKVYYISTFIVIFFFFAYCNFSFLTTSEEEGEKRRSWGKILLASLIVYIPVFIGIFAFVRVRGKIV